jgi:BASS family bile acid:Na+ symporter
MFEFFRALVQIAAPVFVVSTMLNVGLTQKPSEILGHLKNRPFVLKMLLANFVAAPLFMIAMLHFTRFEPALKAGLLIFALGAGAPFLIKLTQTAQHNIALGAAVMLMLMLATVVYMPVVLPLILSGISVDGWAIAKSLFIQLLLPIIVGMLLAQWLTALANKVQPWVAWLGNIALYVLIAATLIGYLPNMISIVGTGAILVGLVFVLGAFGLGYLTGAGKDHLEDVGALGTAQRNTAAGVVVAIQNFGEYPNVLMIMTLANMLGIVMLLFIAKRMSRDNQVEAGIIRKIRRQSSGG